MRHVGSIRVQHLTRYVFQINILSGRSHCGSYRKGPKRRKALESLLCQFKGWGYLVNYLVRDLAVNQSLDCVSQVTDRVTESVQIRLRRFFSDAVRQLRLRSLEIRSRSSVRNAVACERRSFVGLVRNGVRHVLFGRISVKIDSRVTDELKCAIDVHVFIVHVLSRSRRILEHHVDRGLADVLSRERCDDFTVQKSRRGDLSLNKRVKVQDIRRKCLRIQNIAGRIFKFNIQISHCSILLLDDLVGDASQRCNRGQLILDCLAYVCHCSKSGRVIRCSPVKRNGIVTIFKDYKSRIGVEHPAPLRTCLLRAVRRVQMGFVSKTRGTCRVENVSDSNEVANAFPAVIQNLPGFIVGTIHRRQRSAHVDLHELLLSVCVGIVQSLQLSKSLHCGKKVLLCTDFIRSCIVSTFDFRLELIQRLFDSDLRKGMEIRSVGSEFIAHSSASSRKHRCNSCNGAGKRLSHTNSQIVLIVGIALQRELQFGQLRRIRINAHTVGCLCRSPHKIVPCRSVDGNFKRQLGIGGISVDVALGESSEGEGSALHDHAGSEAECADVIAPACKGRVVRSCRSVGGEVDLRILERLLGNKQTVVVCKALCAVPSCRAVGLQSVSLGFKRLACGRIRRACSECIDEKRKSITCDIAGCSIRVGSIHVHRQVACERLAGSDSHRTRKCRGIVLLQRVVGEMCRIVCVRCVGTGNSDFVTSSSCTFIEVRHLRRCNVDGTGADVIDTRELRGTVVTEGDRRCCNSRCCTHVVEQLCHLPGECALSAVVVRDLEVEASALGKELFHIESERGFAHVADSSGSVGFRTVAGNRTGDTRISGSRNRAGGGDSESRLCLDITFPVDHLCSKGTVLLLEVDIPCCSNSDVLRCCSGCVEACMCSSSSPVTDTPGFIRRCRHHHVLGRDAGVRNSAVSDAVFGVEVGAVLVLADTRLDDAVSCLLYSNGTCKVELGNIFLDHAVIVLDCNTRLRLLWKERGIDLACVLVNEPVYHSELRLRIQQVLAAFQLYIFFCHYVFPVLLQGFMVAALRTNAVATTKSTALRTH